MAKQPNIRAGEWTSNGLQLRNGKGKSVLQHAQNVAGSLGTYKAARYLKERGWSMEAALWTLCKSKRQNVVDNF